MSGAWYSKSIKRTLEELSVDPGGGLDRRAVRARRRQYGANDIFALPQKPYRSYLAHLLTDIPTILLVLILLLAIVFEEKYTLILSLVLIALHITAAVAGYARAKRVFDTMGNQALPTAKVLREGKLFLIKQKHLVPGDIIYLSAGDIVPCDARLIETEEVQVLETAVTSVGHAVQKSAEYIGYGDVAPSGRRNMVFASSVITAGRAKAVVCEIGQHTLICKLEKNRPLVSHEDMGMLTALQRLSRIWSVCMLVLVFLLTGFHLMMGASEDLLSAFLTALSLAVGAMSEYYMPFALLIVACGIYAAVRKYRGMQSGAMIKNIGKLDRLRGVNTLVLPLEGIFTSPDHTVDSIYVNGRFYETEQLTGENASPALLHTVRMALLSTGLYGADALKQNNLSGNNVYSPEEDSIIRLADRVGIYNHTLEEQYPLLEHRGIGTLNELETSIMRGNGMNLSAVRGDPAILLDRCSVYRAGDRLMPLDGATRSELMATALSLMKRSYRVIAVASGSTEFSKVVRPSIIQKNLVFEGFLAIRRHLLDGALQSIKKCRENGIRVVLLADRDPAAYGIARALDLVKGEEEVLSGATLAGMKEGIWRLGLKNYTLYTDLSLAQKQMLLDACRQEGETVMVVAKSISEISLFRHAAIGVAGSVTPIDAIGPMGLDMTSRNIPVFGKESDGRLGFCDALKFASDVIISEADAYGRGGFHAVTRAIASARDIYAALHRAIRFLLMTQTARLTFVIFSILFASPLLTPTQILYTGLIGDFLGIALIAFSARGKEISPDCAPRVGNLPRVRDLLLPHLLCPLFGMAFALLTIGLTFLLLPGIGISLTGAERASVTFLAMALFELFAVGYADLGPLWRRPLRIRRMTAMTVLAEGTVLLLCFLLPGFGHLFDFTPPGSVVLLALAGLLVAVSLIGMLWRILRRRRKPDGAEHTL